MTDRSRLVEAEHNDDPVEASRLYERAIAAGQTDLQTYLNLSVLYFVATDGGYAAAHQLNTDFLDTAWSRMNELLDEAEAKFGSDPDILFWRHFYSMFWGDLTSIDREYCEELLSISSTQIPVLGLFPSFAGLSDHEAAQYRPIAEDLYRRVSAGLTVRDRYIRSILETPLRERK